MSFFTELFRDLGTLPTILGFAFIALLLYGIFGSHGGSGKGGSGSGSSSSTTSAPPTA